MANKTISINTTELEKQITAMKALKSDNDLSIALKTVQSKILTQSKGDTANKYIEIPPMLEKLTNQIDDIINKSIFILENADKYFIEKDEDIAKNQYGSS